MVEGTTAAGPIVLLAEDESILRMLTAEALLDAGYQVLEAADGSAGLEAVQSAARIDLLLTDIKMPGLTGYQLAEAALALRPELKVVLMTGYAPEPLPLVLKEAVPKILHKPFNFNQLLTLMSDVLGHPTPKTIRPS